ncbi:MAG: AraC family transcriptional regulator [Cyanobacteria bacterium P01_C01_bin.120]
MTIFLDCNQEYFELFQESDQAELHFDAADQQDRTRHYTGRFIEGWMRWVRLREGITLLIEKTHNHDRLLLNIHECERSLAWYFVLHGKQKSISFPACRGADFSLHEGMFFLHGRGFADRYTDDFADAGPFLFVSIFVWSRVLRSFISDSLEELPQALKHLIRPNERPCYKRAGETSPMMHALLQQILQCPYTGLTKRMYLESKAIELLALLMEEEAEIHQGDVQAALLDLDYRDRIHYAQEILLKNLTDPPSLMKLAHQVGMGDYNLKRRFKEIFGTTVFGYLRDRRLERALQLLLEPWMTVTEAARIVGYESRSAFTTAFKQKYGVSPKAYQMSARK